MVSLSQTNFQCWGKIIRVLLELGSAPVILIVWCKMVRIVVLSESFFPSRLFDNFFFFVHANSDVIWCKAGIMLHSALYSS